MAPEQKIVRKLLNFKPALWQRVEAKVPEGARSAFVAEAVEEKLEREEPQSED